MGNNIGLRIFEIISDSLYTDPKSVFREYIQNSFDSCQSSGKDDHLISILFYSKNKAELLLNYDELENAIKNNEKIALIFADTGAGQVDIRSFDDNLINNIAISEKNNSIDSLIIGQKGIGRYAALSYFDNVVFFDSKLGSGYAKGINFSNIRNDIVEGKDNIKFSTYEKKVDIFELTELLKKINESFQKEFRFLSILENPNDRFHYILLDKNLNDYLTTLIPCKLDHIPLVTVNEIVHHHYENINETCIKTCIFNQKTELRRDLNKYLSDSGQNAYLIELKDYGKAIIDIYSPLTKNNRKNSNIVYGIEIRAKNMLIANTATIISRVSAITGINELQSIVAVECFYLDVLITNPSLKLNSARTWFDFSSSLIGLQFTEFTSQLIQKLDDIRRDFSRIKSEFNRDNTKKVEKLESKLYTNIESLLSCNFPKFSLNSFDKITNSSKKNDSMSDKLAQIFKKYKIDNSALFNDILKLINK